MRKLTYILIIFSLALFLAACGDTDEEASGGAVSAGDKLFHEQVLGKNAGCVTCHSLEPGQVLVGPSLANIGNEAATMVSGESAEEYLRQSILEPNAYILDDFSADVMPTNWGKVLSQEQVNDLVAYLMTLKS